MRFWRPKMLFCNRQWCVGDAVKNALNNETLTHNVLRELVQEKPDLDTPTRIALEHAHNILAESIYLHNEALDSLGSIYEFFVILHGYALVVFV